MNFLSFDESNLRLSSNALSGDALRLPGEASGKARIPETLGNTKIFCHYFFLYSTFFFKLFHLDYPSSDCRVGKQ
ncbi:hypothetical protein SAMN05216428_11658 [Nitrosospira sp. Nsp11]|nr:hypothetical protein SAMN05216428_11658 [Nitrosospira sp. Nsp11]